MAAISRIRMALTIALAATISLVPTTALAGLNIQFCAAIDVRLSWRTLLECLRADWAGGGGAHDCRPAWRRGLVCRAR